MKKLLVCGAAAFMCTTGEKKELSAKTIAIPHEQRWNAATRPLVLRTCLTSEMTNGMGLLPRAQLQCFMLPQPFISLKVCNHIPSTATVCELQVLSLPLSNVHSFLAAVVVLQSSEVFQFNGVLYSNQGPEELLPNHVQIMSKLWLYLTMYTFATVLA